MTKKVPRSRARTAYGLLDAICRVILAEPRRLTMNDWLLRKDNPDTVRHPPRGYPACGTVGCLAGWTVMLAGNPKIGTPNVAYEAADLLGLGGFQPTELFQDPILMREGNTNGQTKRHARNVVKHVRAFQRTYAEQLRNHPVRQREIER